MGFAGVLEDKHLAHVPGTVILNEESAHSQEQTGGLRHGKGKNSNVVLAPQPSEDPNDPLNWPQSKKILLMLILGFGTCLNAATIGPLLNPGLFTISLEFGVPIGNITLLSGYQLLVAGATAPLVSALSRKYGKRPCFMFSSICGLIGSIVGSATTTYGGLLAARIVQGFGIAAYESLIISIIGDLYFVHERGSYISVIQFLLGGVSNFSSVLSGIIVAGLSWKYLFHFLILTIGLQTVLMYFFCPETAYIRDKRYEIDTLVTDDLKGLSEVEHRHGARMNQDEEHQSTKEGREGGLHPVYTHASTVIAVPKRKTFWQETAMFTGTYSDENLLQLILAPLAVCTNVAVLWVTVVSGTITATYVAQAFVLAQVFSLPPYQLSPAGIGYLSLGPFIGGIIGALAIGAVADPMIKWFSARNQGVYEPEYRLVIMICGLLAGGGLTAWGYMIGQGVNMYACSAVHGIIIFGVLGATIATSSYALDAYRDMSNEMFVAGIIFKNFLFYGFSYFVNNWTAESGPAIVFYTFGGVVFALTLSTIPMYIYGKKYRSFWFRHNLLTKFNIRTHAEF